MSDPKGMMPELSGKGETSKTLAALGRMRHLLYLMILCRYSQHDCGTLTVGS